MLASGFFLSVLRSLRLPATWRDKKVCETSSEDEELSVFLSFYSTQIKTTTKFTKSTKVLLDYTTNALLRDLRELRGDILF